MVWESPIYKFRIPINEEEQEEEQLKEVAFDVTLSAPNFKVPGTRLEEVFEEVFKSIEKKKLSILDVGAAKLRNTLYLLGKKYKVCAVEFEKLIKDSNQGREMHTEALKFKDKFCKMLFPNDFLNSSEKFDLVLLINVLGTMPVPSERLLLLNYCNERLNDNGHLFWYSMYGESDYKKRCVEEVKVGDGYYLKESKYKSFFREFKEHEIDYMLLSCGFKRVCKYSVSNNRAILYQKSSPVLIDSSMLATPIETLYQKCKLLAEPQAVQPLIVKKTKDVQPLLPNPDELELDFLWINKLKQIKAGPEEATEFHRLALLILRRIFDMELRNFTIEAEINSGRKRIDIIATNGNESEGFFARLKNYNGINCPYIFMECKNYSDIKNPEVDQLAGRLNPKKGQLGILVSRDVDDKHSLMLRCQDFLDDNKYILPLSDQDLVELLKMRRVGEYADILDYLDNIIRPIILKQYSSDSKGKIKKKA